MSFTNPQFTNAGKKLQARALSGECKIVFTTMGLGDGELTTGSISALVDLINTVKRVNISDLKVINLDQVQLKAVFQNIDLDTGFFWREVGLFAADPDNPDDRTKDILYCYQNAGDLAEYIPSASSQLVDKILNMSVVVADASTVQISFFSESYALKEDLDEQIALQAQSLENHKTDTNAHKDLLNNFAKSVNTYGVLENNNIELSEIRNSYAEDNQKYSSVFGGEAYGKGAGLFAYGAKHAEYPGYFGLYAMTSEGEKAELIGTPAGSLTWQGHNIATTNGIKMQGHILKDTDDSELIVGGATVFNNGAYGAFRGVNFGVAEEAGSFAFKAQGDKQYFLKGTKDGSLKWDDKNLVRSVNGINADNAGNVTVSTSGMPDYTAGVSVSGMGFTAPSNGVWVVCCQYNTGSKIYIKINDTNTFCIHGSSSNQDNPSMYIPLKKGDVVKWSTNPSIIHNSVFYPFL